MELAFIIWAVGTLPGISTAVCLVFGFLGIISIFAYTATKLLSCDNNDTDENRATFKHLAGITRNASLISLVVWFLFLLVPDKTTAYQMLAAYGVQSVAENPKVQEVASDGIDVLKALMKKAKEEIEKEDK